jgi:hypothetical protein
MDKPCIEGELESATNSLQPVSLAEEPPSGGSDIQGSLGAADDLIESPLSESARSQSISIEQGDRGPRPVFHESLPIRAGVVIVALIALSGLAWIAGGSLIPTHVSPSPSVQTVNSSAPSPGSNGGRFQALRDSVREVSSEASAGDNPKRVASPMNRRAQPAVGVAAPNSATIDEHPHTASIRLSGKELDSRTKRMPAAETRPTTIAGWMLREVANGTAVLEGPNGVWRVRRGDTVPGAGRIDSILLWGNRWIVATSQGLISTP